MDSEKLYSKKEFKSVNNNKKKKLTHSHSETLALGVGMGSRAPPGNGGGKFGFRRQENRITIQLTSRSKQEMKEIKRKLVSELDLVRRLVKKIEEVGSRPLNNVSVLEKSKSGGKKQGGTRTVDAKFSNKLFKSCGTLLERLMKHKHGWVFNTPVDPLALGLHDYFDIIKHPMDLGTVKSRLDKNWYNSPMEFAEDVRVTFHNAMTYNPKGQDVYTMAELLLNLFEEKWKVLEADYIRESGLAVNNEISFPIPSSKHAPPQLLPVLNRSESFVPAVDPKAQNTKVSKVGRIPSLKKPKAKEVNKREMTYDEKQKLSMNLQNLPCEKLDNVVQIIKKRNPSLSQKDDEIEVDIDTFDTETLWELDRFVTNYKKSLSKNKRKAEFPNDERTEVESELLNQERIEVESELPNQERIEVESEFPNQERIEGEPEFPNQERIEAEPEFFPNQERIEVEPEFPNQERIEVVPEFPNPERIEVESEFPNQERIEVESEFPNQERIEVESEFLNQERIEAESEFLNQEKIEVESEIPNQERIEVEYEFLNQERIEAESEFPNQERIVAESEFPNQEKIEVESEIPNQERIEVESEYRNQERIEVEPNVPDNNLAPVAVDAPKEAETDERITSCTSPAQLEKHVEEEQAALGDKSSSSSSSSSVSGSSSSDSDSDSSSEAGSDAGHSSKA